MEPLLRTLLGGHEGAVALCLNVFHWANDYDHLVDGDASEADRAEILHRAMAHLIAAHNNPFYIAHREALHATLERSVSTWRVSNSLQRMNDPLAHTLAHVLRWVPIDFFLHCARLVGGEQRVQDMGPWFWLEMTKDHPFEEFARECGG